MEESEKLLRRPSLGSHRFATDLLDRTGKIVLVQKMLGHESVTKTQRYLHPKLTGDSGARKRTQR